jgi:tRNA (cytidine/uridine-2'-O-)-methyltransferase
MAGLHVVLVAPEIHWNTGNVGRTCLALDAELHLVQPLGFSLDERRLRRAGLDYWPRVRLHLWSDWPALEAALPDLGAPFFFGPRAGRLYTDVVYPEATVLVFGCESRGLPAALLESHADSAVFIPMADPALRSLNLSTSVAIGLFEVARQRRVAGWGPGGPGSGGGPLSSS